MKFNQVRVEIYYSKSQLRRKRKFNIPKASFRDAKQMELGCLSLFAISLTFSLSSSRISDIP